MIYDGALAANGVLHTGSWVWCLVIGALIVLWIFIGITNQLKYVQEGEENPAFFPKAHF